MLRMTRRPTRLAALLLLFSPCAANVGRACDQEGFAAQLVQTLREQAADLPQIAESDEHLSEWATQQGVLRDLAEAEAAFGCYEDALKLTTRIDREDSRNEATEMIAFIAATKGDYDAAYHVLDANAALNDSESLSYFIARLTYWGHRKAAMKLLEHYEPSLARSHVCRVYCALAVTAPSREESAKYAQQALAQYTPDAEDDIAQREMLEAMIVAGREAEAGAALLPDLSMNWRELAVEEVAEQLGRSGRRDEAVAFAVRIAAEQAASGSHQNYYYDESDLFEDLYAAGSIHVENIDDLERQAPSDEFRNEVLYYGCIVALKEQKFDRLSDFARRNDGEDAFGRIACRCLTDCNEHCGEVIKALGGPIIIMNKAGLNEYRRARVAAALSLAFARQGEMKLAREKFDSASAHFLRQLAPVPREWHYIDDADELIPLARAAVVLNDVGKIHEILRAKETWFAKNRDTLQWYEQVYELREIAQVWAELGDFKELERMALAEEPKWRDDVLFGAIDHNATEQNGAEYVALIDEATLGEAIEKRVWLKLMVVRKLATGEAHPIHEWSDVAKVNRTPE